MPVITLTMQNFEKTVFESDIVFVDFWASWCAPCLAFAEVYNAMAEDNPEVVFTKVNIEEEEKLAEMFSIQSIPHLLVFKKGIVIYSESGSMPPSTLKELIQQAIDADISKIQEDVKHQS